MPQPDREVRGLRNDLRESCATLDARLAQLLESQGKTNTLLEVLEVKLAQLDKDLTAEAGLGVKFLGQAAPLVSEISEGTVTVANPTDVAGVQTAVESNSETFNSNAWAIAGLFVGLGLLAVLYKLVRP